MVKRIHRTIRKSWRASASRVLSVDDLVMSSEIFDPVGVEREMVTAGMLPPRADTPNPRYATLEHHFTEADPRKYALWRISMVRQFRPEVLRRLSDDDLLYLAGQSPEGYVGKEAYGIRFDRNKVTQNALRARIELDRRATRGAWFRSVSLAAVSLILGVLLTALATWVTD
jgi:hypothetical protein